MGHSRHRVRRNEADGFDADYPGIDEGQYECGALCRPERLLDLQPVTRADLADLDRGGKAVLHDPMSRHDGRASSDRPYACSLPERNSSNVLMPTA
jgi:hypothetical protein